MPASSSKSDPPFDGVIAPDDEHYLILIKHFALDRQAIGAFAAAAHRHGINNVKIVLVPCTNVYARFHDAQIPGESYDHMRQEIRQMCNTAGVQFLDFGDPLTTYGEFHDGYHLNARGALRFTRELVAHQVF